MVPQSRPAIKIKSLHFPGVIYEIACSQPESGLARAAKDYIIESYGQVQKVVGIKVDPDSSRVSLTLWVPSFELDGDIIEVGYRKPVDGDQVRDAQGDALQGSLKLQLRDLGPQSELDRLYPGAEVDRTMEITYRDIVDYIREAESVQETGKDIPAPLCDGTALFCGPLFVLTPSCICDLFNTLLRGRTGALR
jgi:hypothetical protein